MTLALMVPSMISDIMSPLHLHPVSSRDEVPGDHCLGGAGETTCTTMLGMMATPSRDPTTRAFWFSVSLGLDAAWIENVRERQSVAARLSRLAGSVHS
jgi:hypothetical protein